jgi:predicted methyltransferase MtxX (methanogen marker protein 4)
MRSLYLTIILALLSLSIQAQKKSRMSAEQLESQKIAYITTKLELTPEESMKFWPVYNEYSKSVDEIRQKNRSRINIDELTDENAEELVLGSIAMAEAELELKKVYLQKLKVIISMKKIAKLHLLEHNFKREMLMRLKERRTSRKEKERK